MIINKDKLYSTKEVSIMLGRNQQVINRDCRGGKLKCVKVFSQWRIKGEELDLLINPK